MRESRSTLRTNEATTPGRTSGCAASHPNFFTVSIAFDGCSLPVTASHKAACSALKTYAEYVFSSVASSSSELDEKSSRISCLVTRAFLLAGPRCTFLLSFACSCLSCLSSDFPHCWSTTLFFLANDCLLGGSSATWLDCRSSCDANCSCRVPPDRGLHSSLSSLPVVLAVRHVIQALASELGPLHAGSDSGVGSFRSSGISDTGSDRAGVSTSSGESGETSSNDEVIASCFERSTGGFVSNEDDG